jgi:hypothetical protein
VAEYIKEAGIFDESKIEAIVDYVIGAKQMNYTDNLLSVDEKKSLGLNSRLKISKDLIDIFDRDKVNDLNPKDELRKVRIRIDSHLALIRDISIMKKLGFKKARYLGGHDERTCPWCLEHTGKFFDINDDVLHTVENNCTCYKYLRMTSPLCVDYEG